MSRSRPFIDPRNGEEIWFDQRARATAAQLELLADIEGIDLDDLLDEDISQRQVLYRLRVVTEGDLIPPEVLARRQERIRLAELDPICRICDSLGWECEGRITRHHYVPRWMMLLLENYQAYAARSKCTVPICVGRHRDLHLRGSENGPKSIIPFLTVDERRFAQKMLDELRHERPHIWELLEGGDENTYEWQLLRDYHLGEFRHGENAFVLESTEDDKVRPASRAIAEG